MSEKTGGEGRASDLERLAGAHRLPSPVYVTRPVMPPLEGYQRHLARIWEDRWLTNDGPVLKDFEERLAERLGQEHVSVFCNGTIALLVALNALRITGGEVITTPFTFPATVHVLYWNGIRPVFGDIDEETFNLDPGRIESLIGPETRAILPVHVYGIPCDVEAIRAIAERHGLLTIYDAAHAVGVKLDGRSLASFGDVSMLSFHATKLFTTLEGGALVTRSSSLTERIRSLRNFGIADEETVIGPGINGKMNEFQAAFGLMQLDILDGEIAARKERALAYRRGLEGLPGVGFSGDLPGVDHNYSYFPVLIDRETFGLSRDEAHAFLKGCNVHTRKYFFPLCSRYPCYASLPSAGPEKLPVAEKIASRILCLPIYGDLPLETVESVCFLLREAHRLA